VLVKVGDVPAGHLTELPQVTVLGVPSAVNAKVNPNAVPVAGTFVNDIEVIVAFKATWKTVAKLQSSVSTPAEIVGAILVSLKPVNIAVVIVGEVPNTAEPDPVSSEIAAARLADVGVVKNVKTEVLTPVTPLLIQPEPLYFQDLLPYV